jgi:hypothetical protein
MPRASAAIERFPERLSGGASRETGADQFVLDDLNKPGG